MICIEFRDHVDEVLEGVLESEAAERYERHAAVCADCAQELLSATRFLNFMDETGRAALETFDAVNVTQDVSLRVARDAMEIRPSGTPAILRPLRGWPLRLAGAAAVLACVAAVPLLRSESTGPRTLSVGEQSKLSGGERAFIRDGVTVQVDAAALIEVRSATSREVVEMDGGEALFTSAEDEALSVETPYGTTVSSGGSTFQVALSDEEQVSVTVLTGRVQFVRENETRDVVAGQRVVLPRVGPLMTVSIEGIDQGRLESEQLALQVSEYKGEIERLQEELATHRTRSVQNGPEPGNKMVPEDKLESLPWDELARAARVLLPRSPGRRYYDPERMRAVAVFLWHAEEIQKLTGEPYPVDGLYHPAFIERMADSFCDVLAPFAPLKDRQATALAFKTEARIAHNRMGADLTPGEDIVGRLKMFRSMIVAANEHLGANAAAELAEGLHVIDRWAAVRTLQLTPETSTDVASLWSKHFDLVAEQRDALRPVAEQYLRAALVAQADAERILGPSSAPSILFPKSAPKKVEKAEETEPFQRPDVVAEAEVKETLGVIDAKLRIAAPLVEFERKLWALLRDDQRALGYGRNWGLLTFDGS